MRKRAIMSRGVGEEERGVLRLDVVVLGGLPEVVPDHHAVLVGEVVEGLLGVLADPVADDVEVGVAVEAEVGLQVLAGDALRASSMPQLPPRAAMRTPLTLMTR